MSPTDEKAGAAIDAEHPWLGLASFSEETLGYFYGREDEVAELGRRVQRKLLTVLFGQSGLGKTSILRAGIVPRLRPQGYCPVYVRIDYGRDAPPPAEQIKQAIFRETLSSGHWSQTGVAVEGESLWEFLHHRDDTLRDGDGRALTPLLIFDQFEEIFTLAQSDDFGRQRAAEFIDDLADLVENRPPKAVEARLDSDDTAIERFDFARSDYRVLIALREDYLAHLEGLKGAMPSITQNRMRLARMTGAQALDAVLKPGGKLVSQEVAEAIVRFVAGGAELRNAEVEPSLLSLICRELNAARIAQGRSEISADLLAGSHATILAEFYQRALADQPAGVHRFIEEELLTDGGFRENIAQERVQKAFAEAGATPDALAKLVDRRLLRIEERLDVRRVELTHDVLCGVVRASRDLRHEREARDAAEKQLAEQQAREVASRRALARARQVAAGCIVLAVLAVAAAAFGVFGMQRAQATRAMAEAARGESENLIVYLLDDFNRELEPVGRLDIVGELARRAIAYYQALPAELRNADTQRNQALAQVRYASVLRNQGKLDEARQALEAALPALVALRSNGDTNEATTIGLALGHVVRSRVVDARGRGAGVLEAAEQAVAVFGKPVAGAGAASVALRRAQAVALTQLGFVQQRQGRNEPAVETLKSALVAWRGIDQLQNDADAMANFGTASAWLMDAYDAIDQTAEASRIGEEARRVTSQLLDRQPTNMLALRSRALISSNLSRVATSELQRSRQLAAADEAARDWLLLSRIDPTNMITHNNLLVARNNAADALLQLGRPRDALAKYAESRELADATAPRSSMVTGTLSGNYYQAASIAADLGELNQGRQLGVQAFRLYDAWQQTLPPGSADAKLWEMARPTFRAEAAFNEGDLARARAEARGAREGLLLVKPDSDYGRLQVAQRLRQLHVVLGWVEIEAGDFPAAEAQFSRVAEARKGLPTTDAQAKRAQASDNALWALTLARSGRIEQARPLAEKALAFQREVQAGKPDDQMHKTDLALALVAAALTRPNPTQARTLASEAQALFESLPAEARRLRSSQLLQGLITDARRAL